MHLTLQDIKFEGIDFELLEEFVKIHDLQNF